MAPLRSLLGKEAVFPPNAVQLAAIEAMKKLIVEDHVLNVPDEHAAIIASRAWQAHQPAAGFPFEGGADTSKIAMGGAIGQAKEKGGRLRMLLYYSGPLTAAQSQWHPFEQELYGLLNLKRDYVKHFGRIAIVMHTDHGTITRLESYRWIESMPSTTDGTLS